MKASELKRKLERLGCLVEEGTGHWIIQYQGRRSTIPRHPARAIKTRTYHGILKELGIKES
jgi:mRNA interferase HicA